jgi:glycosyltransferase involved in cell wall biosynthesis
MKRVGIVIPWFGRELIGGAEQQAFQVSTRLAARGHTIEVLTTGSRSFSTDWSNNYHASGAREEFGMTIRRFAVDTRDELAFDSVNAKLLGLDPSTLRPGVSPLTPDEARTFNQENIKSGALLNYLRRELESYDAFVFLPYMFAPTVLGLPLVADRAWLQPCLHDEPQAYFPEIAELFRRARGLLFNSEGEFELALRLYGPGIYTRSTIVGEGIEQSTYGAEQLQRPLPESLRGKRFALYLGRRERAKNVDLLVRAFAQFKAAQPSSELQLALAGPGAESFAGVGLHDLGAVADETKAALLFHARVLLQPSRKESFSRTMMEAWLKGRPVVVHRECLATATAVASCSGGWLAATEADWAKIFARIESTGDQELAAVGARGQAYAAEQADWETVMNRYEDLLVTASRRAKRRPTALASPPRVIHQLLPDVAYGDAISNHARTIRDQLRDFGYESQIFAKRRDARVEFECVLFDEKQPGPTDGLFYHHSIGSEVTAFAVAHAGPKCLIYHNVTPADFFAPYRPGFAWMLETGRAGLGKLASQFPLSVGDSAFNAAELRAYGFDAPAVLPIVIDPDRWNIAPDADLLKRLQDGRTNILFVGRIAPNKRQDRLIEMFAEYRRLDSDARLIIAGEGSLSDPYSNKLRATINERDLARHVEITGLIDDAKLLACYRTAHLYWSASEHEGFGAPLIEAMWFDVPVLALSATAVPETIASAGARYEIEEELSTVARRAYQLTHDEAARRVVIAAQRKRRLDFTSASVQPILIELVDRLAPQ